MRAVGNASTQTIRRLLGDLPEPKVPWLLREFQPGDVGWIVYQRKGME
jgi:hypothetical protein